MRYCYGRNICSKSCTDAKAYICCADCNVKNCFWRCHDLDNKDVCKYMTVKEWVDNCGAKVRLGFTSNQKTTLQEKAPDAKITIGSLAKKYGVTYQHIFHLHKHKGLSLEEIDVNLSKK